MSQKVTPLASRRIAAMMGAAAVAGLAAAPARAQSAGSAGVGAIVGSPTGITLKYFAGRTLAVDGGIGFGGDAVFYGDALFHAWDLLPRPAEGTLAAYLGGGPRLQAGDGPAFGLRMVGGISYWLPRHPVELFMEAGPVFELSPQAATDFDVGVGVRLCWKPHR